MVVTWSANSKLSCFIISSYVAAIKLLMNRILMALILESTLGTLMNVYLLKDGILIIFHGTIQDQRLVWVTNDRAEVALVTSH